MDRADRALPKTHAPIGATVNTRNHQRARPYKIVRFYETASRRRHTIATGLTLTEAQAFCHDPDNNSLTCRTEVGKRRTRQFGPWFDHYVRETKRVD
jgi:hypothetical protein